MQFNTKLELPPLPPPPPPPPLPAPHLHLPPQTQTVNTKSTVAENRLHKVTKLFECKLCEKTFATSGTLKRHSKNIHGNARPFECRTCKKAFRDSFHLKRHVKVVHDKVTPFECVSCKKTFADANSLNRHVKSLHDAGSLHTCHICDKVLADASSLKRHINSVHDKVKSFECNSCQKAFRDATSLKRHVALVHSKVKTFECTVCTKRFGSSGALKTHVKTAHDKGRLFECGVCMKKFGEAGILNRHIRTVHGKEKSFHCLICSSKFSEASGLTRHVQNVHDQAKSFECDLCKMKFGEASGLRRHVKSVHDKERPFRCEVCSSAFSSRSNLKKHLAEMPTEHTRRSRSPLSVTKKSLCENKLFLGCKEAFNQEMHHATTEDAEREIMNTRMFKGSRERSGYDGALPADRENEAGHLAYFALSPGELAPFSAFPRQVEAGASTRMALVTLTTIDDLLSSGAKLFHVATTPSQNGMWARRTYQTHVVVARPPFDRTFSSLSGCLELDPDRNDVLYRKCNRSTQESAWWLATKVLEESEDGSRSVRSTRVVLGFPGGLHITNPLSVRWIDSYKYKTIGRANERRLQCPRCDYTNAYSKGLHQHYLRTHIGGSELVSSDAR